MTVGRTSASDKWMNMGGTAGEIMLLSLTVT
ncbi:hypothetical protein SDC9_163572 [bioreactor metagenome]|uniref:Uncharacterized protein n=1 Tax=bioreactor metagenome TaxID=1076179 RepID=A0A645FW26_9ZZZZ